MLSQQGRAASALASAALSPLFLVGILLEFIGLMIQGEVHCSYSCKALSPDSESLTLQPSP